MMIQKLKPYWKQILLLTLIVLTVIFIFSNSLPSREESREQSELVTNVIGPILEIFVGKGNVTVHLVRKLAHFVEFAALGFEVGLLFYTVSVTPLFLLVMTALMDETIQIFTNRGSQVQDVWLDIAGACTGFLCAVAVRCLYRRILQYKKDRFHDIS